jgi:hypothetical protein
MVTVYGWDTANAGIIESVKTRSIFKLVVRMEEEGVSVGRVRVA